LYGHGAALVGQDLEAYRQVGHGQHAGGLLRPLGELEARPSIKIAQACLGPLARIAEAIKIKVQNEPTRGRLVRFHQRIGRAFDAPGHAQRAQQMAHKGRLARPQIAAQFQRGVAQFRRAGQLPRKSGGIGFAGPAILNGFGNRLVTTHGADVKDALNATQLWPRIGAWARELGFAAVGVTGIDLTDAEPHLMQWLAAGFHGSMAYMAAHGVKRARPAQLVPGTVSIITARLDYLPRQAVRDGCVTTDWRGVERARLAHPQEGIISIYARGRDYHKVMRQRLQALQQRIAAAIGPFGHRVFSDSAPVLEVELARRAALGWRGKHTLLIAREAGSMFFLGELFVDFALPATAISPPARARAAPNAAGLCGRCRACLDACPTQAIIAPERLDARRCISYLTIEHDGSIPTALRPLIGNRIYGCDDCQLACPWNKFACRSPLPDFDPRPGLTRTALTDLFAWDEPEFLRRTEGCAIRRIGHPRWLRNIAVALGNALAALPPDDPRRAPLMAALTARMAHPHPLVREHVRWALAR